MKELVDETVISITRYLPIVIRHCEMTSTLLYQDKEKDAMKIWSEITESIEWLTSAISGIQKNGFILNIKLEGINPFLIEIETQMKTNNTILVADIITYEINPLLCSWLDEVNNNY